MLNDKRMNSTKAAENTVYLLLGIQDDRTAERSDIGEVAELMVNKIKIAKFQGN